MSEPDYMIPLKHRSKAKCSGVIKLLFVAIGAGLTVFMPAPVAAAGNLYSFDNGLRLGEARLFTPWWAAVQRNALQRVEFDLCRANVKTCSHQQRLLRALVERGSALPVTDKLQLVNRFLNRREYTIDRRSNAPESASEPVPGQRPARSHWSTLYEFMQRGGDCEDYAAAKYFLLRMLGLQPGSMRVVVVWERELRGFHAVLAYQQPDGEVWLLESDNVIKKRSHAGYRYVYALNEKGIWDYRTRASLERNK